MIASQLELNLTIDERKIVKNIKKDIKIPFPPPQYPKFKFIDLFLIRRVRSHLHLHLHLMVT